MPKTTQRVLDPKVEVRLFVWLLLQIGACKEAREELLKYGSLKEVYKQWKNADWAAWLVGRYLSKKKALQIGISAAEIYLRAEHPKATKGKTWKPTVAGVSSAFSEYSTNTYNDVDVVSELRYAAGERSRGQWFANAISTCVQYCCWDIGGDPVPGRAKKILPLIKEILPEDAFLKLVRKAISKLSETEIPSDEELTEY